jgi:hypothetical protein
MRLKAISFAVAMTAFRCGAKAANDLDSFLNKRPIDCAPVSLDQYGRTVAVCSIDGVDLAEWLVRNGLALDWPTYSKGKYDKAQREAEHAGRGMWAGSYVETAAARTLRRDNASNGLIAVRRAARQSKSVRFSWERFIQFVARFFPPIRTLHPLPCHRFDARTRGRSPVR